MLNKPDVWTAILVLGASLEIGAATSKYRVLWHEDPSTTMVVGWVQGSGTDAVVHYGPVDKGTVYSAYPQTKTVTRTALQSGMNHKFARLTGLLPNTNYYYVLRDNEGVSIRMWFKTAPSDTGTAFTVVAGGDSRDNRAPRQRANRMVGKLRPLFVLFGGDMTGLDSDAEWSDWWDDWQLTRSADGRMYPVMAARGNHEQSNILVQNMFDSPNPSIYYALDIGGKLMRVYTLNTEISHAGDQLIWFKKDLADNSARIWKILQYHGPMRPHETGKPDSKGLYDNWSGPIYQHRINLVVESHSHVVKTTWPIRPSVESGSDAGFIRDDQTGTVFTGEGTWGAPLRAYNNARTWTRSGGSFNQFNWIHVTAAKMTHRKVKVDNVDSVGSVNDAEPFAYPARLDVFNPPTGAVVTLNPSRLPVSVADSKADPHHVAGLQTLRISADRLSLLRGESIRLLDLPGDARVRIHDLKGGWVRSLESDSRSGTEMAWNGHGSNGRPAPAGLYHLKVSLRNGTAKVFQVSLNP